MTKDERALGVWRDGIRGILNRVWDPIGGCPDDEYDGYVGKLAALIRDGASDGELLAYLEWAEVEHIGLGPPFDALRGAEVVAALRAPGSPLGPSTNS